MSDTLIDKGYIGKTIVVGPSTGSDDSQVYACVNMLHPDLTTNRGIGTGRFEDYFIQDLIPHIDSSFRTIPDRAHREIDGFSLGGFTSTVPPYLYKIMSQFRGAFHGGFTSFI